jgi:hypothetical protein
VEHRQAILDPRGAVVDDVIRDAGFRRASLATVDRVIRLLKTDEAAFGDAYREPQARLSAAERLQRRRQREDAR